MRAKITITGLGKLQNDIDYLLDAAELSTVDYLNEIADRAHKIAFDAIVSNTAHGRTYRRYNPFRIHTASAPGQYPASDTGRLAEDIRPIFTNDLTKPALFGTMLVYGRYLEHGTYKMAARPWLLNSVEQAAWETRGDLVDMFESRL